MNHKTHEVELPAAPSDGVTSVRFSRSQQQKNLLLVSSWDAQLRVYENSRLRASYDLENPLLSCCFGGNSQTEAFCGGLDCQVKQLDLTTRQSVTVGHHEAAVRAVEYSRDFGLTVSGGWDGHVRVWDVRNANNQQIHEAKFDGGKVFGMDLLSHLLVVATSSREVGVFDLRNFSKPLQKRESPLKYQTRCVRLFHDLSGFAMGSIEGRVALEYFADYDQQQANETTATSSSSGSKKSYAFKCHRGKIDDQLFIYPVNAIAFHPIYNTFATGGCDGLVNVWDGANKKRIHSFRKYPTSIASLDFNEDGSLLAVASSYTFEEGEKDHPSDAIFIRTIEDSEVRPKKKQPTV